MGTSVDHGEFGAAAVITLFAVAEESGGGRKKSRFLTGSSPVRNDKAREVGKNDRVREAGNNDKASERGSDEGRAVRKHKGKALTGKQLGEIGEAEFLAKASGMGFVVSKPWGDSNRYDFIVDSEGKLCRVQVKSAYKVGEHGSYSVRAHGHSYVAYQGSEIDALVAYVVPLDAWYLFPVRVFRRLKSLKLFPGSRRKRSKFEKWREAWGILRGKDGR